VWVKVQHDALSLTDRDITTATWGPELRHIHILLYGALVKLLEFEIFENVILA